VAQRKELEDALAEAEAALAAAARDLPPLGTGRDEAIAEIEKARAYCRQARAALIDLSRTEATAKPDEKVGVLIRKLLEISEPHAPAGVPAAPSGKLAVRGDSRKSQDGSQRPDSNRRSDADRAAPEPGTPDAPAMPSLARQGVSLLSLSASYLQYYFFDVHLQILSLPSLFPLPFQ
jgi:hypothetical protein